ncbi:MAG: short-subunit dehydrogenase [Sulfurimonas sp.]|jgi:short-subunit dehydrogenase
MKKKIWIIGGSSGIGLELVKKYLVNNDNVIVSARNATNSEALKALCLENPQSLKLVDIDVVSTQSVNSSTQEAWSTYEGIDICVYNAGAYESMKMDEWNMEHFEAMAQVNYLGAVRLMNALNPLFILQRKGHFVFNLSISSYLGLPYGGGYSAPKAALLNFCESIQPELFVNNIKVQVINHGFVKTRLTDKNDFHMPQLLEPKEAAQNIFEALQKPYKFEIRFPFLMTSFLNILRMLPYKISLAITKKAL